MSRKEKAETTTPKAESVELNDIVMLALSVRNGKIIVLATQANGMKLTQTIDSVSVSVSIKA